MTRESILRRLLLVVIIAAIPAFVAHIAFQVASDVRMAKEHTAMDAWDISAAVMPLLKTSLIVGDLATAQETLDTIGGHGHFRALKIVDRKSNAVLVDGHRDAGGAGGLAGSIGDRLDFRFSEQKFPIEVGGVTYGVLVVEPSTRYLIDDIWQRIGTTLVIWLMTLAIFLVLIRVALHRALQQLCDLADAAHEFGGGNFNCRAPVGDILEIAETAMAFNHMADSLSAAWRKSDDLQATLEERVATRTRDLSRANAELEQFAYVASHDLRQPLRMVDSYLKLIERRMGRDLTPDIRDFMGFAIDGAKRMDILINDLLEYSRTGRTAAARTALPLGDAVSDALAILKPAAVECGADIQVAAGMPVVNACRNDVVRLFQNLVGNALKYRHPERLPQILISYVVHDDACEVRIQDNGIGIPKDQTEHIFRIFQRLHTDSEYEGTGIGLSICQKIVDYHGGRIWAESEPGQGSTFHFTLPYPALAAEDSEPPAKPGDAV